MSAEETVLDWMPARRLRRNLRLPVAALVASGLAYLYANEVRTSSVLFAAMAVVLLPIFAFLVVLRDAFPRAVPSRVKLSATELVVEGRAPIARASIVELRQTSRSGKGGDTVVELVADGGERERLWMTESSAESLVQAIGPRRARFRIALPTSTRFFAALAIAAVPSFVLGVATHAPAVGVFALAAGSLFWALVLTLLLWLVPGTAIVGADGVTTSFFFVRRFLSFREVAEVSSRFRSAGHVDSILVLKRGGRRWLVARETPDTEADRGTEGRALLSHLVTAFSLWQQRVRGAAELSELVAPSGRTASDWRAALQALVQGTGYRAASVSAERLAAILDDPAADRRARIGAAAALVRVGDDALRARVRVAAATSADADLRETMLAVAESDTDDRLDDALRRALR